MKASLCKVVLENGTELAWWDSYSINSDFLTPCDGWSISLGGDSYWSDVVALVQPNARVQIWIDGVQVLTGFVDSVRTSSTPDGGVRVDVQGRDILRPLVKANIHPSFSVKGLTLEQMVSRVVAMYYKDPPDIFSGPEAQRDALELTGNFKPKSRDAQKKKVIDYCQAHPNEGAFEFLSRNLRRFGLWLWADAQGRLVIGGPTYDQAPSYQIKRVRGQRSIGYLSATYAQDQTNVPDYLEVRGKSTAKEWEKSTVRATVSPLSQEELSDQRAGRWDTVSPVYIQHDQAETPEQCAAFARQELSRLQENADVYEVTAMDHRCRVTGNIFMVDTVAAVEDQYCHVRDNLWVAARTFSKSVTGGTTTALRMLPLHTIQFSEVDAP